MVTIGCVANAVSFTRVVATWIDTWVALPAPRVMFCTALVKPVEAKVKT